MTPRISPTTGAFLLETMTRRAEFLCAARAMCAPQPGFLLQARKRKDVEGLAPGLIRVGFTCSRKVGNAVVRNRAKRRLRAVARQVLPDAGYTGWDYVLVGRAGVTVSRAYLDLLADMTAALKVVHG
ncbi:MAG: ribonuclease P protein component [Rhodobacteraceae bacterium]|nr:ribonuclease P protein component [Paracoccaceae bacterium]